MLAFLLILTALVVLVPAIWFARDDLVIGVTVGFFTLIGCVAVWVFGGAIAHGFYNEHTETCTVTEKDRGGQDGSYRVYTEQCGVLANTDSLFRGKFDSADVWNDIEVGQTYEFTVVGWRFEPLSSFPNILSVRPAN